MRARPLLRVAAVAALACLAGAAAAAPVTWNLSGVTFSDGATASGSFSYDAGSNTYSAWSVSVTAGTLGAFTYDSSDSHLNTGFNADATGFVIVANTFARYFDLNFVGPLTGAGGTVALELLPSNSFVSAGFGAFECGNCGPFRRVTAGVVTTRPSVAVPEPASAILAGAALLAAGWARRRS